MASIDELISTLRSSTRRAGESSDTDLSFNSSDIRVSSSDDMTYLIENQKSITTQDPQTQTRHHSMCFDLLDHVRKKHKCFATVLDVLGSKAFKVEMFIAIIKSIKRYSEEVSVIELVDQTGTIEGSMQSFLEDKFGLKTGEVLILTECSLWKVGTVHLNIVESNVVLQ